MSPGCRVQRTSRQGASICHLPSALDSRRDAKPENATIWQFDGRAGPGSAVIVSGVGDVGTRRRTRRPLGQESHHLVGVIAECSVEESARAAPQCGPDRCARYSRPASAPGRRRGCLRSRVARGWPLGVLQRWLADSADTQAGRIQHSWRVEEGRSSGSQRAATRAVQKEPGGRLARHLFVSCHALDGSMHCPSVELPHGGGA